SCRWPNQKLDDSSEFHDWNIFVDFPELEPPNCNEIAAPAPPQAPEPEPFLDDPWHYQGYQGQLPPPPPPPQQQQQTLVYPANSREHEIKEMSDFIKLVIESRSNRPDGLSSRVRVHEVILIVLLITQGALNGLAVHFPAGLAGILAFCDDLGRRCSGESGFFKALDTETMALLWQRIKGNRTGKYETFARAMRVRRANKAGTDGYFAAQDFGRCKKKRVYRLGGKSQEEMQRLRCTLHEFAQQQQKEEKIYKYYG
uniref:ETS domain-containing protein n=1 Tax=Macrostomum lignano TaxID=282301 RepID=A0A1I8GJB6_9PLAT